MEKSTENVLKEYLNTLGPDLNAISALEIEDLFADNPLSVREMDEAFQFLHKQGIKVTIDAQKLFEQTAQALASAIDAKDSYTNGHSHRVAYYSVKIAEELGLPKDECDRIYFAALLHDVGKIGVPIEILSKPGRLTDLLYGMDDIIHWKGRKQWHLKKQKNIWKDTDWQTGSS